MDCLTSQLKSRPRLIPVNFFINFVFTSYKSSILPYANEDSDNVNEIWKMNLNLYKQTLKQINVLILNWEM